MIESARFARLNRRECSEAADDLTRYRWTEEARRKREDTTRWLGRHDGCDENTKTVCIECTTRRVGRTRVWDFGIKLADTPGLGDPPASLAMPSERNSVVKTARY